MTTHMNGPRMRRKVAKAIEPLRDPTKFVRVCAHHVVDGDGPTAMLCLAHPEAGVTCPACALDHSETEHDEPEGCDACGVAFAPTDMAAMGTPTAIPVKAARGLGPDGQATDFTGAVVLWGAWFCPDCATPPTDATA
jgi:hypothetical protein